MNTPLQRYLAQLRTNLRSGNATEHTHRMALMELLQAEDGVTTVNEPTRIDGNGPDILVQRGGAVQGHIETKDIGANLQIERNSEQLKRYLDAFPNLLLTDYLDFLWFVEGEERAALSLGRVEPSGRIKALPGTEAKWRKFLGGFQSLPALQVATPQSLARHLAGQTRLLQSASLILLRAGDKELQAMHDAFSKVLLPAIEAERFADMFAQTIAYGLFTARCFESAPQRFSRARASECIPHSNPFLRRFFNFIAGPDLHPDIRWLVERIVELLSCADMHAVLQQQGRRSGFEDPVFHLYETFLAAYDSEERQRRGVYYTPEPVVDFIVRGVDELLQSPEYFNRPTGLADENTLILDPAAGTATFLRRVVQSIHARQVRIGQGGGWNAYVHERLLPRIFGFELMMAPYTVAHLKLAMQLDESGYQFKDNERLHIYLTNTLEQIRHRSGLLLARWLSDEAEAAEIVKRNKPVQVVIGNPPYAVHSANESDWARDLLDEYKKEPDGSKLRERNPAPINDDYVKFLRFAHWRVLQTGHGIVAFVTNHGWLDNPTFRGMRASLLRDFDEIRILDLHGNTRKKERAPDGGRDSNVFDIQQGVAVVFLLRREDEASAGRAEQRARVFHRDLWGERAEKYGALFEAGILDGDWKEVEPRLPLLIFKPVDWKLADEYEAGWKVTDIFPVNATGFVTHRDNFALDFERDKLENRIADFTNPANSDDEARERYFGIEPRGEYAPGDNRDWKMSEARSALQSDKNWRSAMRFCLYRPFDIRPIFYHRAAIDFGRWEIMRHMLDGENLALITSRMTKGESFAHILATDQIVEKICLSSKTSNNAFIFPLYLYPAPPKAGAPQSSIPASESSHRSQPDSKGRFPNLHPDFIQELENRLDLQYAPDPKRADNCIQFGPEDIFHYAYAVLHAPAYRARYAEYLRSDFPRLPLPPARDGSALFFRLTELGGELAELHMLRGSALDELTTHYPRPGSDRVEKVRYEAARERVHINSNQYFGGVTREDWEFLVGGYKVLSKWLKNRKGRALGAEEIERWQRTATAIRHTCRLMQAVDAAIPHWPIS